MASLKDIRVRIGSVKKTQKTTSAMKIVSSVKLQRAQRDIQDALPYSTKLKQTVSSLSSHLSEESHVLFKKTKGPRVGVILITSDRGLCGGFNTNLCKALAEKLGQDGATEVELFLLGKKGQDFFKKGAYRVQKLYSNVTPAQQLQVVRDVLSLAV